MNIPALFTALATAVGFSICCPIGCTQLPNVNTYLVTAITHSQFQATVNVTTTRGLTFLPQRFFSNRMDVVNTETNGCEGLFNFTSRGTGLETACPWQYKCDYNPQRIPPFIFHASCNNVIPQGNHQNGFCEEIHYPVSYILTRSCDPLGESENTFWEFKTSTIPVSCNLKTYTTQ